MSKLDLVLEGMELVISNYTPNMPSRVPLDGMEGMCVCLNCMNVWRTPTVQQQFFYKCTECEPDALITPQAWVNLDAIETGLNPWVAYGVILMLKAITTNRVDTLPPDILQHFN